MSIELPLLPDVEQLVSAYLRRDPRTAALVGERVYTAFPAKAGTAPLVLVTLVGGQPPMSNPLVVDAPQLQLDCYGGGKREAAELLATVRAALAVLEGTSQPEGVCAAVRFGLAQYLPDDTYRPPRPRYLLDVTITTRAAPASATRQPSGVTG